jgi:hypothetical protein
VSSSGARIGRVSDPNGVFDSEASGVRLEAAEYPVGMESALPVVPERLPAAENDHGPD